MVCRQCGTSNAASEEKCASCGAPLDLRDQETLAATGFVSTRAASVAVPARGSDETVPVHDFATAVEAYAPSGHVTPLAPIGIPAKAQPFPEFGPRYKVESLLGEGGMGAVYKAYDRDLDRTVALKLVRSDLMSNPDVLVRFKQELLLASRISHKNILRIHDL